MRLSRTFILLLVFILVPVLHVYTVDAEDAPPVINILSPQNPSQITHGNNMNILVRATTSGNVRAMAIYLDNVVKANANAPGISHVLDCSMLQIGSHTIRVTADNGKIAEKTITLNIIYPNTVINLTPNNIQEEKGKAVKISATANDGGFTILELAVDGKVISRVQKKSVSTQLDYLLQTSGMQVGDHRIAAVAKAGNGSIIAQTSGLIRLVESATPPPLTVRLVKPDPRAPVTVTQEKNVQVAATALGGSEGVHLTLYLDGNKKLDVAGKSLSYNLVIKGLSIGKHTISIIGRDSKNQKAEAATTITVQKSVTPEVPISKIKG